MKIVHSRTQAEWNTYFQERLGGLREYLRAHGEQGALLGFIVGIFIVLFFKLSLFIFILAALAYLSVQMLAPKE